MSQTNSPSVSLVELNAGYDGFVAQAISDICADEGIDVQLILASDPYVGMDHTSPHRMMVRPDDVPAVERIVADHFPELLAADDPPVALVAPALRRPVRLAVGLLLALVVIVPMVGFGVAVLVDVLQTLT